MTLENNGVTTYIPELSKDTVEVLKKLEMRPESEILNSEALRVVRSVWPQAFHVSSPQPLKIGIHKDMAAMEIVPLHIINIALRFFTTLERYLGAIKPSAVRIALDGKPAGKVKLREAVDAEIKLFNLFDKTLLAPIERKRVIVKKMRLLSVKKVGS